MANMKVFDYSWHEKQCIKLLSSLSSYCFGFRSFPDSVTDTIKVRNIQESKRYNALNDMNNHKPNAFKPFKPLLRASQFPRFRNRGYQSQEHSRKQEGTYLQGLLSFFLLNLKHISFMWPVCCWIFLQSDGVLLPSPAPWGLALHAGTCTQVYLYYSASFKVVKLVFSSSSNLLFWDFLYTGAFGWGGESKVLEFWSFLPTS